VVRYNDIPSLALGNIVVLVFRRHGSLQVKFPVQQSFVKNADNATAAPLGAPDSVHSADVSIRFFILAETKGRPEAGDVMAFYFEVQYDVCLFLPHDFRYGTVTLSPGFITLILSSVWEF